MEENEKRRISRQELSLPFRRCILHRFKDGNREKAGETSTDRKSPPPLLRNGGMEGIQFVDSGVICNRWVSYLE